MSKKIIIPTILFIAVFILSFIILFENKEDNLPNNTAEENQQTEESQIILFYGDGCPACAVVEDYIGENNIQERVEFEQKEVYYNKKNADELSEKAKTCGISANSIQIPFLWDGSKCFVGSQTIIDFFNQKLK